MAFIQGIEIKTVGRVISLVMHIKAGTKGVQNTFLSCREAHLVRYVELGNVNR